MSLYNNIVQTLKTANTVKDISMVITRKLPTFSIYIFEGNFQRMQIRWRPELHSEEP